MTSSGGQVAWQARYKVWGALLQETDGPYRNPSPEGKDYRPLPQNLRFQGQYFDAETGLHYNTFRYYDPDVGRFTTEDPIGLNGGLNLYQYAPNPFAWIDPWGLNCKGRSGKQERLRALLNDPKQPRWIRGWIKNELRHIKNKNRKTIRLPGNSRKSKSGGKVLAHKRGKRAKNGNSYEHSVLQDTDIHKLEHKHGGY